MQSKKTSDKLMDYFLFAFFAGGLLLAFFYETWSIGFGVGILSLTAYYSVKIALPDSNLYQYVLSTVYGIFMAQYIYQMHGLFEMHFIAFIASAILITYQNWKLQIPLAIIVLGHHVLFNYLQYSGIKEVYFTTGGFMDLQTFLIHGALATSVFFICGLWAYNFKKYGEAHINMTYKMTQLQEEKVQQEKLFLAERLLSEAQKLAQMGNWNADLINNEIFWSEGIRHTYGVTNDVKGSLEAFLAIVHPEDREIVEIEMQNVLDTGALLESEFRIIRPDGQVRWLASQTWVRLDEERKPTRIFGIQQDITDRKHAEQESLELMENLQRQNKDLQMFAYMVSHNLRAPIAKIMSMVELFKKKPDLREQMVDLIANETVDLDQVIKDMNAVISSRRIDNKEQVFVLFETKLNMIKQVLENDIKASDIVITHDFKFAEGLTTIKSYLYSIMYNLLSNALKYRRTEVQTLIHFSSGVRGKYIFLSVADNGCGINLEKNGEKLFGLYNRFHPEHTQGRGIGLNLVKNQVESLGGKIDVESTPGEGTTFTVWLPTGPVVDG